MAATVAVEAVGYTVALVFPCHTASYMHVVCVCMILCCAYYIMACFRMPWSGNPEILISQ